MEYGQVDAFGDIATLFDAMEKAGKVDLAVLDKIDILSHDLLKSEEFWLANKKVSRVDAFTFYHAFRNMRSVLARVRERFVKAEEAHDNPTVVDDARIVFPSMFNLLLTVKPLEDQSLNPGLRSHVLGKIRDMRRAATHAGMLPSNSEGVTVNEKEVSQETQNLAETFRELLAREV